MELKYPLGLCKNGVKIIDSPGLNEHDSRTEVSMGYLGKADAVVMVLSCKQLLSKSELQFIEGDLSANRDLNQNFFLLNHFDAIRDEPDDLADIKQLAEAKFAKLAVPRERVYFVSARDALLGRRDNNLSLIKESGIGQFEQALELLRNHSIPLVAQASEISNFDDEPLDFVEDDLAIINFEKTEVVGVAPIESTLLADLEGDEILEFDEIVHHQPSTTHEGSASSKTAMPAIISKEDNPLSRLPSFSAASPRGLPEKPHESHPSPAQRLRQDRRH